MDAYKNKTDVIEMLSELFKDKGIKNELIEYLDLYDDIGIDSLTFISMIVALEEHFNIVIPDEYLVMERMRNVMDIVSLLDKLQSSQLREEE